MSYPLGINFQNTLYIISSILFIFGLKMLGKVDTARKGNLISAIGMLIAIITALLSDKVIHWQWILVGLAAGTLFGAITARIVAMTSMPEMVALFNGFGGLASLLVGWGEFHKLYSAGTLLSASGYQVLIILITILIGGVTFTGSLVAWGKLSGVFTTKPVLYPGQQFVNALILIIIVGVSALLASPLSVVIENAIGIAIPPYILFLVIVVTSGILGILSVIPIGGGDMPVVISLLNSYSGMAACAAGFVVMNNVLIVAGALVGSSGIILTNIMCKAMNRSLANVLFSGFGAGTIGGKSKAVTGEAKPVNIEDCYLLLEAAKSIVIVPGYGMAVAQAQHAVHELGTLLEENGCEVDYAIHPVAGRMPGHMNVLLAEANVEYDKLREMDDINPQMENIEIAIVIGANDVVNPAAKTDPGSPIYGMPIIDVDKCRTVIILKRSLNPGFAGIDNPLFFADNTRMLFGDAKASVQGLIAEFKS